MKFKTSHIIVGLLFFTLAPNLLKSDPEATAINEEQAAINAQLQAGQRNASNALKASELAVQRVTAGCVAVIDASTKATAPMVVGELVTAVDDPTGQRTLADGTLICNAIRHTAEVQGGRIAAVAIAAPEHAAQYDQLFNQQQQR